MRRYRLLTWLLLPLLVGHTAWSALRARELRYLTQRFGWGARLPTDYWIHAASVGEVKAAAPLLRGLRRAAPHARLTLTTTTPTGAAVARTLPQVAHAYLPLDTGGAVRRFLRRARPRCAVIMETELWPQLYRACARREIPLVIVNARLSSRTLRAGPWLRGLYAEALGHVSAVLARSAEDAAAYRSLGAPAERVTVVGNIKFAAEAQAPPAPPLPRPFLLAASTHDDEELRLTRAWLAQPWHADWLLVLAPRHPPRVPELLRRLEALGVRPVVHSRGDRVQADTRVYVIDVVGQLAPFLAHAHAVFVGGSLIPRGGHNVLEPALYGRPVLFGPHMDNFADEARALLASDAALEVADDAALATALRSLHAAPDVWEARGARGAAWCARQVQVAQDYAEAIMARCPPDNPPAGPATAD
ncbi:3-deoxy-D-manno-octulosonic acid transferase [Ectothiorhodospiraceae bacterium 2226]|nr:3-deoxy-D-manno-octulosonic acid transferase [Ectothiorhodospiraceae bacterium 2226]